MQFGSSLMSLEIGLPREDFTTAADLAWPRTGVRFLLHRCFLLVFGLRKIERRRTRMGIDPATMVR